MSSSNKPTIHFVKTDFRTTFTNYKIGFPFLNSKEISFNISTPEKRFRYILTRIKLTLVELIYNWQIK